MLEGVIFDLDGVLVSTDQLHYRAWKILADELGIADYGIKDNEMQRGINRMDSLEILLKKSKKYYTLENKVKLADKKNGYYQELLSAAGKEILLPGALETLELLKKQKMKIAVGSSSQNANQIIDKVEIRKYFDVCICGMDIMRAKPDPEIFIRAAEGIRVECGLCLVVEDSGAGIEAAKRAGMRTLGVGSCFWKLEADYLAKDLISVNEWEKILKG